MPRIAALGAPALLRRIWLEWRGHLSMFFIPPFRYTYTPVEMPRPFRRTNTERSMRVKIGEVFGQVGEKGTYDYDFGSTTRLTIERTGARVGRISKRSVRLLVRNDPLPWTCGACGAPATLICRVHEGDDSPFVCAAHEATLGCDSGMFLPVVNSPRMGVCGYTG